MNKKHRNKLLIFLIVISGLAGGIIMFSVRKLNEIFPEPVAQVAGGKAKAPAVSDDSEVAAAIVAAMFSKK